MKSISVIIGLLFTIGLWGITISSKDNYDIFIPIAKYIKKGDAEKLSAWFDKNLEITILTKSGNCSKNQAKQIVKSFFENYKPRDFEITHTAGKNNMKYALGNLKAGGENFEATIFVNLKEKEGYKIKILKIEKKDY